jgi:hypothetical protein
MLQVLLQWVERRKKQLVKGVILKKMYHILKMPELQNNRRRRIVIQNPFEIFSFSLVSVFKGLISVDGVVGIMSCYGL